MSLRLNYTPFASLPMNRRIATKRRTKPVLLDSRQEHDVKRQKIRAWKIEMGPVPNVLARVTDVCTAKSDL